MYKYNSRAFKDQWMEEYWWAKRGSDRRANGKMDACGVRGKKKKRREEKTGKAKGRVSGC